jgi:hypothetical protein
MIWDFFAWVPARQRCLAHVRLLYARGCDTKKWSIMIARTNLMS